MLLSSLDYIDILGLLLRASLVARFDIVHRVLPVDPAMFRHRGVNRLDLFEVVRGIMFNLVFIFTESIGVISPFEIFILLSLNFLNEPGFNLIIVRVRLLITPDLLTCEKICLYLNR